MLDILALLMSIGHEVSDPEEGITLMVYLITHTKNAKLMKISESFIIRCQTLTSLNLGLIDSDASQLKVEVGNREFLIHQSLSLLSSDRSGGTTGAGKM